MRAGNALSGFRRRLSVLKNSGPGGLRFLALWKLGSWLLPDYHFRFLQLDWQADKDFKAYLQKFGQVGNLDGGRRWTLHQLARLAANVPGDTAECGVLAGAMSYLICKANEASPHPRMHYLFDSFEGLSRPGDQDGRYWQAGDLNVHESVVAANLSGCRNFSMMKGWIPSRFAEVADRKFAFVHIDVDLHEPTRDSLEFFYPRMSDGGIIILDDYGSSFCPGATLAVDTLLADKPEKMISLADGGGFLIKGTPVMPAPRLSGEGA
jgi:hypothetical protein